MKRSFIILILSTVMLGGCKKYLDVNKDPNNPVDVQEALILAPVEVNISDNILGGNAAINIQYFVQTIAPNQENPGNWSCGVIPDTNTDVIISSGTVILNSNTSVRTLSLGPSVSFTINPGFNLIITH